MIIIIYNTSVYRISMYDMEYLMYNMCNMVEAEQL